MLLDQFTLLTQFRQTQLLRAQFSVTRSQTQQTQQTHQKHQSQPPNQPETSHTQTETDTISSTEATHILPHPNRQQRKLHELFFEPSTDMPTHKCPHYFLPCLSRRFLSRPTPFSQKNTDLLPPKQPINDLSLT